MSNLRTILVITKDAVLTGIIEKILMDYYRVVCFSNIQSSLNYIYNSTPDMMVIGTDVYNSISINILHEMKTDPVFGQMPAIAVFDDNFPIPKQDYLLIDDYLRRAHLETDLLARVNLCVHRTEMMVEVNPLTRLPGNIAIIKQIQRRLDSFKKFALAYADLDHFKPYNDKYGFSRGDEVLKMLGRLILNTVRDKQPQGSFVGHIGGDDFIFITDIENAEDASMEIIDNFNKIIPAFYDSEDRVNGYIESVDREGIKKSFPLMGISIGVVCNRGRNFSHYGEIAEVVSEMKQYAKALGGNCFKIDKRHA